MNHAVTTILGCTVSITGPDAPGVARRLAQAADFQAETDRMHAAALDAEDADEDVIVGPGAIKAAASTACAFLFLSLCLWFVAPFVAGWSHQIIENYFHFRG